MANQTIIGSKTRERLDSTPKRICASSIDE